MDARRHIRYAAWYFVFIAACAFLEACATTYRPPPLWPPLSCTVLPEPDLFCEIAAPARVKAGGAVPVTVTLKNLSNDVLRVRSAILPGPRWPGEIFVRTERDLLSPIRNPEYEVRNPKAEKRGYVTMGPGERAMGMVDLAEVVPQLRSPGRYEIVYRGFIYELYRTFFTPSRPRKRLITCNQIILEVMPASPANLDKSCVPGTLSAR